MLFIFFRLGKEQYALEATRVIEVVPRLPLRPQPGTPDYVAGLFNYHGVVVPVLNLGTLTSGVPCQERLSTRIILVDRTLKDGAKKVLGLIAEAVTDAVEKEPSDFSAAGVVTGQAPYLGTIALDEGGMIQRVLPEHLLPVEVERLLFSENPSGESAK
ncbi:MAG: chemotaxis protein CheW [Verrucomicrobiia bacterium]